MDHLNSNCKSAYVSPEGKVLAIKEVRPMFQSGIRRYPLEEGRWYKLARIEEIPPAPNSGDFLWVIQYEDDELFKAIPHKPEYFLTMEQWRHQQITKLEL